MRKWKIWLLSALALIALGGVIFVITMSINGWDFKKLGGQKFTTKTFEVQEEFENISVDAITTDVTFAAATDGKCKIVAYEGEKRPCSVSVAEGTLTVRVEDNHSWQDNLFNVETPRLTVYLPKTTYGTLFIDVTTGDVQIPKSFTFSEVTMDMTTGDVEYSATALGAVKIALTTGDIELDGAQAKAFDLKTTTGEVSASNVLCDSMKIETSSGETELENVACKTLFTDGTTGSIELTNVIASENMYIERTTGDVELERCDGGEITIKMSTGDVYGSLLTEKVFVVDTSTGDKNVPQSASGGKCTITTTTGDISIRIAK